MLTIELFMDYEKTSTNKIQYLEELGEINAAYLLRVEELIKQYLYEKNLYCMSYTKNDRNFKQANISQLSEYSLANICSVKRILNCTNNDISYCTYKYNWGMPNSKITLLIEFEIKDKQTKYTTYQKVYVYM